MSNNDNTTAKRTYNIGSRPEPLNVGICKACFVKSKPRRVM